MQIRILNRAYEKNQKTIELFINDYVTCTDIVKRNIKIL